MWGEGDEDGEVRKNGWSEIARSGERRWRGDRGDKRRSNGRESEDIEGREAQREIEAGRLILLQQHIPLHQHMLLLNILCATRYTAAHLKHGRSIRGDAVEGRCV